MNILMLNHNVIWRSTFFRAFYFARELASRGHRVTVATISRDRLFTPRVSEIVDVKIVDPERLSGDRVAFGSTVRVRDEEGNEREYIIVGEGETDFHTGGISYQSPVAKVLIGRRVGDVVLARRPAGEIELEIVGLAFAGREA